MHPDGTPTQFLMCQLSLHQSPVIVSTAFAHLRKLSVKAVSSFAIVLRNAIEQKLPNRPLLLVIDEMESAVVVMTENFVSRQTTADGFDKQGQGLLTPLLQAANDLSVGGRFNLLLMGTSSVLARSASATSSTGKGRLHKSHSEQFPMATKEEVNRMLTSLLGIDDEVIEQVEEVSKYLYNARFRLLARTIEQFIVRENMTNLRERLKAAVQESVTTHKEDLLRRLNERASTTNRHLNQAFLDDLHDVYVSAILSGGKFISDQFSRLDTVVVQDEGKREDWCRLGIAQVDDELEFHVMEQFAFETIYDFFENRPGLVESLAFKQSIKDLERVIDRCQTTTAGKGDLFENIISHALKSLKGMTVANLPFVQVGGSRHTAKRRWTKAQMNVDRVVRVPPLPNDAVFLANSAPGTLFSPTKAHRADGLSLFDSGELLSFGATLYFKAVSSKLTLSQYRSTDPSAAYEFADEKRLNPGAAADRTSWEQLRLHEKIAFRPHVNIPRPQLPFLADANRKLLEPGTTILPDESLVVNIDVSNINQFFAGIKDKELRKSVYRLLYRITRAPELAELVK